jgi:hypothetical protein
MIIAKKQDTLIIAIVAVKVIHSFPFVVIIQPYHFLLTKSNSFRDLGVCLSSHLKPVDKPVENAPASFFEKDQAVLNHA